MSTNITGINLPLNVKIQDELKQRKVLVESLILKILKSNQLLSDHVEALEQCIHHMYDMHILPDIKTYEEIENKVSKPIERFTGRNTLFLLCGTVLQGFAVPKSLRLTIIPTLLLTTGFSALYATKVFYGCRNKLSEQIINSLIKTINDFGRCIRRTMVYFRQLRLARYHERKTEVRTLLEDDILKEDARLDAMRADRTWDCITAAKEASELLFDATRKLEELYPLPQLFHQYYEAMEDLRECDFFKANITSLTDRNIKEYHNIFAYVQSQFLLRLALTIYIRPSMEGIVDDLKKVDDILQKFIRGEQEHFQKLQQEITQKWKDEVQKRALGPMPMRFKDGSVLRVQEATQRLNSGLTVVAENCMQMEMALQDLSFIDKNDKNNAKNLLEVAQAMHAMEIGLTNAYTQFKDITLYYNNYLNATLQKPCNGGKGRNGRKDYEQEELNEEETVKDDESTLFVEVQKDENNKDDFFAYLVEEPKPKTSKEINDELISRETNALDFEIRFAAEKFHPVLQELKVQIDPIRKDMLEKEREVLMSKGIDISSLDKKRRSPDDSDSDSEESDSEKHLLRKVYKHERKEGAEDKYAENRQFLAEKKPINLFKMPEAIPMPPPVDSAETNESVFESEC